MAAAHPGAQIARRFFDIHDGIKDRRFEDPDRDLQFRRILLDQLPVLRIIPGIHHQECEFKRELVMALQLLEELRHQHGVLPAGDADRHVIARCKQFVGINCFCKW